MLTALTILCLAPVANKAFHIDDPLFLWSARQIQAHPADPFGVTVNWYGTEMPLAEVTKNPPGVCYYIALVAYGVGWGEVGLHLAFLLPAVMAVLGTYFLARRFCTKPTMAAVTALVMPVFWVSSTTVMSDTMMLAWWVWATVSWVRGMEKREPFSLALAAFLIAVAAMTKYFAVSLIPLLLVYSIVRERRLGWWAAYLLIPVAVLMGCEWAARSLYGHGMLFDAGSYALEASHRVGWTSRGLTTLVFTGGCVVAALFYAPLLWSRKGLFYGILVTVLVAGVFLEMETLGNFPLHHDEGGRWLALMQLSVLAAGGISLLALAAADLWQRRDAGSVLLVLWIVGTFVFTWILNWTVNGRSILPMVPAAGILLVRRIERRLGSSVGKRLRLQWWPLVPTGLLALAVVWADVQLAGTARAAAGEIHDRYKGERGTVWFQGHWGFQYYMESRGGKAIDVKGSRLAPGDLVVIPNNNTNLFPIRPEWFLRIARSEQPGCRWLATMNPVVGAGFYADVWGPLPFAVGSVPPEYYDVLRFR